MMQKVRKSARPTSTWLGGEVWVPKACRNSERTMMMRVKPVIIRTMAGMNVRLVSSSRVWIDSDHCVPPPGAGVLVTAGSACAQPSVGRVRRTNTGNSLRRRPRIAFLQHFPEPARHVLRGRGRQGLARHFRESVDAGWRDAQHQPFFSHFDDDDALTRAQRSTADNPYQIAMTALVAGQPLEQPQAPDQYSQDGEKAKQHLHYAAAGRRGGSSGL